VTVTGSPAAQPLYDARRGVYYAKPVLRGWLHLLCFGASLVAGPLLLAGGHGAARMTAVAIYSASVSALFGISALYHRGTWTEAGRRRLQRLDHAMIFFLIAGTATPALLLDAPGAFGLACLIVMWTLTLTAAAIHLAWMNAPELLVGGTFVGLGWAAGLSLPWVWVHAGVAPGILMLVGVRIPRGLSCLRLRRRDLPVCRDSVVHCLNRHDHLASSGEFALRSAREQPAAVIDT
jgi:hemolysin III